MSDASKEKKNPFLDLSELSGFQFGPAWAKAEEDLQKEYKKTYSSDRREGRGDRRGRRPGDGREGGGRDGRDGREGRDGRGMRDRRDQRQPGGGRGMRDRREQRPERAPLVPTEKVRVEIRPVDAGLATLSQEIHKRKRCFSLLDLAKVVMGGRDRYEIWYIKEEQGPNFYYCKKAPAVWLTEAEALSYLWNTPIIGEYYEEVVEEVEAPKGQFTAIAKCGMSGTIIGPVNWHGYQPALARLHAERFAHMPFDKFKSRIVVEKSEESVQAWLDSCTKRIAWRPKRTIVSVEVVETAEVTEASRTPEAPEVPELDAVVDSVADVKADEEVALNQETVTEEMTPELVEAEAPEASETSEVASEEEPVTPAEESAPADEADEEVIILRDRAAVIADLKEHHFAEIYDITHKCFVSGDVAQKNLSSGLFAHLLKAVEPARRHPSNIIPNICHGLARHRLPLFKWKGGYHTGPSRPHAVPADIILADRMKSILEWVKSNSGKRVDAMLNELAAPLPEKTEEASTEATEEIVNIHAEWVADLLWLLQEGYVLVMTDGRIYLSKNNSAPSSAKEGEASADAGDASSKKKGKNKKSKGKPSTNESSSKEKSGSKPAVKKVDPSELSSEPSSEIASSNESPQSSADVPAEASVQDSDSPEIPASAPVEEPVEASVADSEPCTEECKAEDKVEEGNESEVISSETETKSSEA